MQIFKVKHCDYSSVLQVSYKLYKTGVSCVKCITSGMQKGFIHNFWGKKKISVDNYSPC